MMQATCLCFPLFPRSFLPGLSFSFAKQERNLLMQKTVERQRFGLEFSLAALGGGIVKGLENTGYSVQHLRQKPRASQGRVAANFACDQGF
jgi:hypothetical protein